MKTKSIVRLCAVCLIAFYTALPSAWGQGSLTPPGPPAPTMKTLAQIEPRTSISSAPFNITTPGSYYLTTNLTVSSSNAITISANHVTLDLNGFAITSTSASPSGSGVQIGPSRTNISIRNGAIAGKATQTAGVFSGGGFDSGIIFTLDLNNTNTLGLPSNARVSNINVSGCLSYGIWLPGFGTTVESCTVHVAGTSGVTASTVKNCIALQCGTYGINGSIVVDCQGQCVADGGRAIVASYSAENCYGESTTGTGVFASQTAVNCYGSANGNEYGLYAEVAMNCSARNNTGTGMRATSSAINCRAQGGTAGLSADLNAENCYGRSNTNGVGLSAGNASNCYGYCPAGASGVGLSAGQAMNCFGQTGGGVAISAGVAIGCHGRCYGNNYAISATILNSCIGYREVGTPTFSFGSKYNMP